MGRGKGRGGKAPPRKSNLRKEMDKMVSSEDEPPPDDDDDDSAEDMDVDYTGGGYNGGGRGSVRATPGASGEGALHYEPHCTASEHMSK